MSDSSKPNQHESTNEVRESDEPTAVPGDAPLADGILPRGVPADGCETSESTIEEAAQSGNPAAETQALDQPGDGHTDGSAETNPVPGAGVAPTDTAIIESSLPGEVAASEGHQDAGMVVESAAETGIPVETLKTADASREVSNVRADFDDGTDVRESGESADESADRETYGESWDSAGASPDEGPEYHWPTPPDEQVRQPPLPWLDWRFSFVLPLAALGILATLLWNVLMVNELVTFNVEDAETGASIAGATVVVGQKVYAVGEDGRLVIERPETEVMVTIEADGYYAVVGDLDHSVASNQSVTLRPRSEP